MTDTVQRPAQELADPKQLLLAYLDFYRSTLLAKLEGLSDAELRGSILPSGWSPLGLLKHLRYVEQRWLVWGFEAARVETPWGDRDPHTGWYVAPEETYESLRAEFVTQTDKSREIVERAELTDRANAGGRFATADEAPYLSWILFHLMQEYARHVGHLDIVRELLDGSTGE